MTTREPYVSQADERLIQRFLDGELSDADRSQLRARFAEEPALREALSEAQELRAMFRPGREAVVGDLGPAFSARVLTEVRQLPSRSELAKVAFGDPDAERSLITAMRRTLVAAAILMGFALILYSGLFTRPDASQIQANPAEMRQLIERIDAEINAAASGSNELEQRDERDALEDELGEQRGK